MSEDHEAEIRASVAAHRDLGSGIVTGRSGPATAHVFMVALIWIAIAVINFVYAHRR